MKSVKKLLGAVLGASLILTGCVSGVSSASRKLSQGDSVGAIEDLGKRLSKKANDQKAADLFVSLYPSQVEMRLTDRTVDDVRREFRTTAGGRDESDALDSRYYYAGNAKSMLSDSYIDSALREAKTLIKNLEELSRIQVAVAPVPRYIGDEKKGIIYEVDKYSRNFTLEYQNAKKSLGEFYYNIAETCLPGNSIEDKEQIIEIYKMASKYTDIANIKTRCAKLNYEIGEEYMKRGGVSNLQTAVTKFEEAQKWYPNYSDTVTKIKECYYDMAMDLKRDAKTVLDYEKVVQYLNKADNYRDSATQLKDVKYSLAMLYKESGTANDYDKAGEIFISLNDYKNAKNEAEVYRFYKNVQSSRDDASDGKISLTSEKRTMNNPMSRSTSVLNDTYVNLSLSAKTSIIDTYTSTSGNVVYPGAVFTGESIPSQKFVPLTGARNPLKISVESMKRGSEVTTIENPASANDVQRGIVKVAEKFPYSPTYEYEIEEVFSPEDIRMTTGMGVDRNKVLFANESSSWMENKHYVLVKATQIFYSASIEDPKLVSDFFAATSGSVKAGNCGPVSPYYVSTVYYGRKAHFLIVSDLDADEIKADIEKYRPKDRINSGSTGTAVNSDLKTKWSRNNTSIGAITVSEKIYAINDVAGMYSWLKIGADMNIDDDELVPVQFILKSLKTNRYAVLSQKDTSRVKKSVMHIQDEVKEETSDTGTAVSGPATGSGDTVKVFGSKADFSISNPSSRNVYGCTNYVKNGNDAAVYTFEVKSSDLTNCVFSWDTNVVQSITINGLKMINGMSGINLRDVAGNTISLDIVDAKGYRNHCLLLIRSI